MTTDQWKTEAILISILSWSVTVGLNSCLLLFYLAANHKAHISLHVTEPEIWQELQLELSVACHACCGSWVRCLHISLNHG